MNAIERAGSAADRFQQRWPVLAFPVAVWKKFNDDKAANLAALISYYGFAAIFPLLLLLVTVLNIVLKNNASLRDNLLESALAQYPVIGPQIKNSLGTIPGTGLPLIIAIVFLVLGARGVAGAMQNALCEVWAIPKGQRPGFPVQQVWALGLVFFVGIGFIVTTFLSGVAGGYVVSHQLHRAAEEYGTFGIVLGLLAWLYLQAELTLYAAEVDTVLARPLWPRSLYSAQEKPAKATPGPPEPDQDTDSGQAPVPPQRAPAPASDNPAPASDKKAGTLP